MRADPLKSFGFLLLGILLGSVSAYYIPLFSSNYLNSQKEPPPIETTPTPDISTTKSFTDSLGQYQMILPKDWIRLEMGDDFPSVNQFQASDGSILVIYTEKTLENNLTDFLSSKDKTDQTGWEGQPSKRVIDKLEVEVFGLPAVRRTEHWLAADFQTINTYSLINGVVYHFYIIPLELPYNQTEVFSKYQDVIDSFEPLSRGVSSP